MIITDEDLTIYQVYEIERTCTVTYIQITKNLLLRVFFYDAYLEFIVLLCLRVTSDMDWIDFENTRKMLLK